MSRTPRPLLLPFLLAAACHAPPEVSSWGTVAEALGQGRTQARVELSAVTRPGTWGVGALAGLAGEVTVADGEAVVSRVRAGQPVTTRGAGAGERATVLFLARVQAWRRIPVPEDVPAAGFEAFVARSAERAGLAGAFAFRVEGPLLDLAMHVIDGECPIRAGHMGVEVRRPPFRLRAGAVDGRLVGIFARDGGGRSAHHGHLTHVHVILEGDAPVTGHVEAVGLRAGAVLWLPADTV